ncbi:unnamed protein product [Calicophoron daubneyi]|uniref:LisH domain-containing protein ARMC9 n=1 Tax=Calicophoron daubneyi TaxID=300641 RepID=A0AAV2TSA2_CALDB
MSANASKGDVLELFEEFFEYYQFHKTSSSFKSESRVFSNVDIKDWRPLNNFVKKNKIIEELRNGDRDELFNSLVNILPDKLMESKDYQRLEFEMNLYIATLSWDSKQALEQQQAMQGFRQYLERKGHFLSQSTDILPYYALPYCPNPKDHPVYQQLFKPVWRNSVVIRLSALVDSVLSPDDICQPRLIKLLTDQNSRRDRILRQLNNELADAEKRASQSQRRFSKLQVDYQTLISVTADLLDALENSLKGIKIDDAAMQRIYSRLVDNQHGHRGLEQIDFNVSNTLALSLRDSLQNFPPPESGRTSKNNWNEKNGVPLFELDYPKIKTDITRIDDRKKCYLLQALRWRLTKSTVQQRENCLTSFVRHDLLDLTTVGAHGDAAQDGGALLSCLHSKHHRVREYMARFINSLASLCRGRAYLAQNSTVVHILIDELLKEHDESITRENLVGALQKMSLRRSMQTIMIKLSVVPWVVSLLENADSLSDYTLEYAVALCMNLCLRTAGKRSCLVISGRILKVLVDLLGSENLDIVPYVNGALYSILALPEIRKVAKNNDLERTLQGFIKPEQPEMNRQFEFIIRRLRSNEPSPVNDSDDDADDDDDEEDTPTLESDLDRQDLPPPDPSDLKSLSGSDAALRDPRLWVGEGLLKHSYAAQPVVRGEANGGVDWCKPLLSRENEGRMSISSTKGTGVLLRPITPGQRPPRGSVSESRPSTGNRSVRSVGRQSAVSGRSSRDNVATLSQSVGDADTDKTPRGSVNLDSDPLRESVRRLPDNRSIPTHREEPESSYPPSGKTKRKVSAFESRPKISRTPENLSPVKNRSFDLNENASPDSTTVSHASARSKRSQPSGRESSSVKTKRTESKDDSGREEGENDGKSGEEEKEEEHDSSDEDIDNGNVDGSKCDAAMNGAEGDEHAEEDSEDEDEDENAEDDENDENTENE